MGEYSEKSQARPEELCHLLGSVFVPYRCVTTKHADSVMVGNRLSAGRQGDLSRACSADNGTASSPLTPGTGLPGRGRWAAQGVFSDGPAVRGSRGTGRPLEGGLPSDSSASPLIHWLKQATWPCPRSRGGKSIAPMLRLWQGCGCRRGLRPGPVIPSIPASDPGFSG